MFYKALLLTLLIANSVIAGPVAMNEEELDDTSASFYGGSPEEIQENVDKENGISVEMLTNQPINTNFTPNTSGVFIGTESQTRTHEMLKNIDPVTFMQGLSQ